MTYEELAARYAIRVCWGCRAKGVDHRVGAHTSDGKIHWGKRRVNRPGLRNFLKLVASSYMGLSWASEPHKTYWQSVMADDFARELHVRFPRSYAALDRARVREALGKTTVDPVTRRMMVRWSR